eukprot:TRINITY_DN49386_c0_g1_i1.p1 TRINITY_DN49386_c0_g1~~TRINITY_DN49386_c0_g1_i1.p1  ORF type:complete len:463 (+),score=42.65 TRINITY_DN49386_c0_g1_i1:87-1475(+)
MAIAHGLEVASLESLGEDCESDDRIVARFLLRIAYRRCGGLPVLSHVVLLLGDYAPKLSSLAKLFNAYVMKAVAFPPRALSPFRADSVLELLDSHGFFPSYVVPLVDSVVYAADVLNKRLRRLANDPATSGLRCDKFLQQEALRIAGLSAPEQLSTCDAEVAIEFAARFGQVVVKPRNSSGGDGVWLCDGPAQVSAAFTAELGRRNAENELNNALIVTELLRGEEWVVNTVTSAGIHHVTDVWRGPPKALSSPTDDVHGARFIYDTQFLVVSDSEELGAIIDFTKRALNACGVCFGAAHTELVWVTGRGPHLYEVNARCAGGIPRTPSSWRNQLGLLVMSVCDEVAFADLPSLVFLSTGSLTVSKRLSSSSAVVFLRAPFAGWLRPDAIAALEALPSFFRFEREMLGVSKPHVALRVCETTGLSSSPGALVLQGEDIQVRADAAAVREIEITAYTLELPALD